MFEPNIRAHRPSRNDSLATQPAYLYPKGRAIIVQPAPLEKGYAIDLILGFRHYRYTGTIAPLSFDLFILANRVGAVPTPV